MLESIHDGCCSETPTASLHPRGSNGGAPNPDRVVLLPRRALCFRPCHPDRVVPTVRLVCARPQVSTTVNCRNYTDDPTSSIRIADSRS